MDDRFKELSERDRRIARVSQFHFRETNEALGRRLRLNERVVRSTLARLVDTGVFNPIAWLDPYRLGFGSYLLYFSVAAKAKQEQALIRLLESSPYVSWFGVLGGSHHYAICVCARSAREFADWIDRAESRFGGLFVNKHISTLLNHRIFPAKYLSPKAANDEELFITETRDTYTPDEIDIALLSNLSGSALRSTPEMSHRIKVPRSTVQYRLDQLEKRGVIPRFLYALNPAAIGAVAYKLLIYARGSRVELRDPLVEFARHHCNVVNISECLGSWDFECTVEVERNEDLLQVSNDLYSKFGSQISHVNVLTVFSQHQSKRFMHLSMADL